MLNLPKSVNGGGTNLNYMYDAAGRKLRKVSSGATTDYVSGIQYKSDGTIDFVQTEEGQAKRSGSSYAYYYDLKDHLGNVRATFYRNPNSNNADVLQRDDYYSFGLRKVGTVAGDNKYLYNGKELQDETGQYDYGARFYDPVIGRWTSVDPSAEKDAVYSPYIYGFDNSVRFTDPDGRWPDWRAIVHTANDVIGGAVNAYASDVSGAQAPTSHHRSASAYNFGRKVGHVIAAVQGTSEMISGGEMMVGGAAAAAPTGGLSLGVSAVGGVVAVHGGLTIKNAILNMASGKGDDDASNSNQNQSTNNKTSFVVNNKGEVVAIPKGAEGPVSPERGTGMVYKGGSGGSGMNKKVTGVRIMDANKNQGRRVNYMNKDGQTVDPVSGQTISNKDPRGHLPYQN